MDSLAQAIHDYRMSDKTRSVVEHTKLLLLAGVAGAGKNTVLNELLQDQDRYHRIISHTSRAPRSNHGMMEEDGIDYHFMSATEAAELIEQRAFVEVKYVHGNVYGTSTRELAVAREAGRIAVADIDIQGVIEYLDIKPDTHAIFLLPPSAETWLKRLEKRYGKLDEHEAEIRKRFRTARDEITHILQDERFVLVINDDLPTTIERVKGVIDGRVNHTSEYAEAVTGHLLDFLETKL